MIVEQIRERLTIALKSGNTEERDILKVALGEIQTLKERQGKITEEQCQKVIKKIIDGNNETIQVYAIGRWEPDKKKKLENENVILQSLLPVFWTEQKIALFIMDNDKPYCNEICDAKSDGQAIGIAMKYLKQDGAIIEGKTVSEVVKQIRIKEQK